MDGLVTFTASLMWRLGAGMMSITLHSVRWLMTMPRQSGLTCTQINSLIHPKLTLS